MLSATEAFVTAFAPLSFFSSMGPVKYFWQSWQCQKTFFVMFQQQKLLLQFLHPLSCFFSMSPVKYFPQSWHCQKTFFIMFQQQKLLLQLLHPYNFSPVWFLSNISGKVGNVKNIFSYVSTTEAFVTAFAPLSFFFSMGPVKYFW